MSKVLVTGAEGFIGKALVSKLKSGGYDTIGIGSGEGDISGGEPLNTFRSEEIKHVFHLASKNYVPDSWTDPASFYRTNVLGTQQVLEFCKSRGAGLTYVSAYLYGIPAKLPIAESDNVRPNNPYAHTKYLAEQICEFYSREFHVPVTIIRPFNVFGTGQRKDFLIPTIIDQARTGEAIKVKDLSPKRDYVFIDDLVDALIRTIRKKENYNIYNIGSGYSLSVREIIDTIQSVMKTAKPVESEENVRKNEIPDVAADITKAAKELGWVPRTSFLEGIFKMLK